MEQRLLHTPEGVRDIYSGEYARKKALLQKLHRVVEGYGYCDIETPTFEYFDVFSREIGTTPSKDLYKFFDREGNTLVLRPDMTPAIARAYAKYFSNEELGVRLSYMGNTFVNNSSLQGHLKEMTQLGAELIGDGSVEADAEITAMIVEMLLAAGLTEFQVSIGHVEFFQSLLAEAGVDKATEQELRRLITNKNNFGVETLLEERNMNEKLTNLFKRLPQMFGNIEVLDQAESMTDNTQALAAIARLRKLYEIIRKYGYEKYITFDLGVVSKYKYYTGIIFQAYTYGTGEAVAKGGRYDTLMDHFGKPAPAIGFVCVIDRLLSALNRQNIRVGMNRPLTLLLYYPEEAQTAIACAGKLRQTQEDTELLCMDADKNVDDYRAYAKKRDVSKLCYYKDGHFVAETLKEIERPGVERR